MKGNAMKVSHQKIIGALKNGMTLFYCKFLRTDMLKVQASICVNKKSLSQFGIF